MSHIAIVRMTRASPDLESIYSALLLDCSDASNTLSAGKYRLQLSSPILFLFAVKAHSQIKNLLHKISCRISLAKINSATNLLSLELSSINCLSMRISFSPIASIFFLSANTRLLQSHKPTADLCDNFTCRLLHYCYSVIFFLTRR